MRQVADALKCVAAHLGNQVAELRETLPPKQFEEYRDRVVTTLNHLAEESELVEAYIAALPKPLPESVKVEPPKVRAKKAAPVEGYEEPEAVLKEQKAAAIPAPVQTVAAVAKKTTDIFAGLTGSQQALLGSIMGGAAKPAPVAKPAPAPAPAPAPVAKVEPDEPEQPMSTVPSGLVVEVGTFISCGVPYSDALGTQLSEAYGLPKETIETLWNE